MGFAVCTTLCCIGVGLAAPPKLGAQPGPEPAGELDSPPPDIADRDDGEIDGEIDLQEEDGLARGIRAMNERRFEEAAAVLWAETARRPDDWHVHYLLGLALRKLGQNEAAIDALKRSIELRPDCFRCHYAIGWAYRKLDDDSRAAAHFRYALELRPGDPDAAEMLDDLVTPTPLRILGGPAFALLATLGGVLVGGLTGLLLGGVATGFDELGGGVSVGSIMGAQLVAAASFQNGNAGGSMAWTLFGGQMGLSLAGPLWALSDPDPLGAIAILVAAPIVGMLVGYEVSGALRSPWIPGRRYPASIAERPLTLPAQSISSAISSLYRSDGIGGIGSSFRYGIVDDLELRVAFDSILLRRTFDDPSFGNLSLAMRYRFVEGPVEVAAEATFVAPLQDELRGQLSVPVRIHAAPAVAIDTGVTGHFARVDVETETGVEVTETVGVVGLPAAVRWSPIESIFFTVESGLLIADIGRGAVAAPLAIAMGTVFDGDHGPDADLQLGIVWPTLVRSDVAASTTGGDFYLEARAVFHDFQ